MIQKLRSCSHETCLATLAFLCLVAAPARASLFLDYSDGLVLMSEFVNNSDLIDGSVQGSVGLNGSYFGEALPGYAPTISVNGHLNFQGDSDYFNYPLGSTFIDRLAPMWQDYKISAGSGGRIVENFDDDLNYYAVTWLNMENEVAGGDPGNFASFQAIYFLNAKKLNGISFNSGDIVFSYGLFTGGFVGAEPTVGLENYMGDYAVLPGTELTSGVFYSDFGNVLPNGAGEYVLFRANGLGNYDVSVQSAIPEPSTYAALAGGLVLMGAIVLRRRQRD